MQSSGSFTLAVVGWLWDSKFPRKVRVKAEPRHRTETGRGVGAAAAAGAAAGRLRRPSKRAARRALWRHLRRAAARLCAAPRRGARRTRRLQSAHGALSRRDATAGSARGVPATTP